MGLRLRHQYLVVLRLTKNKPWYCFDTIRKVTQNKTEEIRPAILADRSS